MDATQQHLADQIHQARRTGTRLRIVGGDSKSFLGNRTDETHAETIDCSQYKGIVDYQKEELMIRVKAGTPLVEVEKLLLENGQLLPFEPPEFAGGSTIGGVVAAGLSGPARPYFGSVRDYVLGVSFIDGRGIAYEMGGQVMKNVAGYDVSRLLVGSLGEMGLICDVSFKVLPAVQTSATFISRVTASEAVAEFQHLQRTGAPVTASAWVDGCAYVRVGGSTITVTHAAQRVNGDQMEAQAGLGFWRDLKNQQLSAFQGEGPLWRISVEPGSTALLDEVQVLEWGGGIRWLNAPDFNPRTRTDPLSVTLFRQGQNKDPGQAPVPFQTLTGTVLELNKRLKRQFDPASILNTGRLLEV